MLYRMTHFNLFTINHRELADSIAYKSFIKNNPHIQIAFTPRHGKHPHVTGHWGMFTLHHTHTPSGFHNRFF